MVVKSVVVLTFALGLSACEDDLVPVEVVGLKVSSDDRGRCADFDARVVVGVFDAEERGDVDGESECVLMENETLWIAPGGTCIGGGQHPDR